MSLNVLFSRHHNKFHLFSSLLLDIKPLNNTIMQAYYNFSQLLLTHPPPVGKNAGGGGHNFHRFGRRPLRVSATITNNSDSVDDDEEFRPLARLLPSASKSMRWTDVPINIMRTTAEKKINKQRSNVNVTPGNKVVVVDPKPNKGLVSKAVDSMERVLVKLMYGSSSSRPQHYLSGPFAPLCSETPPVIDLPIKGQRIPDCLNGEFMMVAPNPKFKPIAGYQWFDGDGMVHGIRIKKGKATYVSRYVKTSKLKQEEFFGAAKFMKIGDLCGPFGLFVVFMQWLRQKLRVLDTSFGTGTANTSLIYHGGLLLALHEVDSPYVLKVLEDGDLETTGTLNYGNRLGHNFTAHPKIDPITGEMFAFGNFLASPYVMYAVISKDGFMQDPVTITIPRPVMMHDFSITENYAIFMDLPWYFSLKDMVIEKKSVYTFDATRKARFGILPRYAKNEHQIKWFELPNCFIFHNANAWEEGDEVVLICCRIQHPNFDTFGGDVKEKADGHISELYEMRFNMKTGLAFQRKLSPPAIEFPRINESYMGRKQRYVYGSIIDIIELVKGIAKFDLHEEPEAGKEKIEIGGNVKGIFDLGHSIIGSEAIFVPRVPSTTIEEDDGYLIFLVHDDNIRKSMAYIIDAKTMSSDPVSIIELPHRIPCGFHTSFMTEEQLQKQTSF